MSILKFWVSGTTGSGTVVRLCRPRYYRWVRSGTTAQAVLPPTDQRYYRLSPRRYYRFQERYYRLRSNTSEFLQPVPLSHSYFLAYASPFHLLSLVFLCLVQVVVAPLLSQLVARIQSVLALSILRKPFREVMKKEMQRQFLPEGWPRNLLPRSRKKRPSLCQK